jgi:hypothetical protein
MDIQSTALRPAVGGGLADLDNPLCGRIVVVLL